MDQQGSRLPRPKSTLNLRTISSTSSLRPPSRLHAPAPTRPAAAPARAGPSIARKPSNQLGAAGSARPTTTKAVPSEPLTRPLVQARSMVQLPKVRARLSPKTRPGMSAPARRVALKTDIRLSAQRSPSASDAVTASNPARRVVSIIEPSPLAPKKSMKPPPVTPARRPLPVIDTPLLPRLVSRPFPRVSMGLLKDEEMCFTDNSFVSCTRHCRG